MHGQECFWEAALNCVLDDAGGVLFHGFAEGLALQATGVTGVTIVFLGVSLVARKLDLVGVDDDDEVTGVDMRGVGGLMLALKDGSGLDGDAAENQVLCVDQDPLALNLTGLCVISLHVNPPLVA